MEKVDLTKIAIKKTIAILEGLGIKYRRKDFVENDSLIITSNGDIMTMVYFNDERRGSDLKKVEKELHDYPNCRVFTDYAQFLFTHRDLELACLKADDFAIKLRLGQSVGTGFYELTRIGTRRQITEFRITYRTKAGDFLPQEWRIRILEAIEAEGETPLLEKIEQHCRLHFAWLHKESEIEEYAANCLAARAYRHWKDFQE